MRFLRISALPGRYRRFGFGLHIAFLMYAASTHSAIGASTDVTSDQTPTEKELPAVSVRAAPDPEPTVGYRPLTSQISGGGERKISEIPQSVAVVSSSVMQDQQARSLDDVLGNVSGIT